MENLGPFTSSATLSVAIDPNRSFSGRSGAVVVKSSDGQVVADRTLVQRAAGCLYSLDPSAIYVDARGSYWPIEEPGVPTTVHVHAEPADCRWTATPGVPWLTISVLSRSSGTGDGTIDVFIAPNNQPSSRAGALVVAGLSGLNPDAPLNVKQTGR